MKEFDLEYVKEHWEEAQAGKLLQTRNGKPVRLLCLDAKRTTYHIIGLIQYPIDGEAIESWAIDGKYNGDNNHHLDLVIKTIKYEGWINIYQGECKPLSSEIFSTEKEARTTINKLYHYITTVKIEWGGNKL